MTPRSNLTRPGAAVCSLFVALLFFSSVVRAQVVPQENGPTSGKEPVAARSDSVRSSVVTTRYEAATAAIAPMEFQHGLNKKVMENPAALGLLDRRNAGRRLETGVVISNGVAVIPQSLVATPDRPLSKDPFVAAQQINVRWAEKQHNLIYADPELKTLNDEIRQLEKQILVKRQLLNSKLASNAEMAKIDEERKKAFETLTAARQQGGVRVSDGQQQEVLTR